MWVHFFLLALAPSTVPPQPVIQLPQADDSIYALAVDPARYRGHDYVMLLDDGFLRVEEDGQRSYSLRQVAQILTNDGAAAWGEFQINYVAGRQRVAIHRMRVIENGVVVHDGPAHQQESSQLVDQSTPVYTDGRVIQATLAGVGVGVIVDFHFTVDTYAPSLAHDFLYHWAVNSAVPIMRSRFVLDTPASLEFRIREDNLNFSPTEETTNGRRIRTWTTRDVPAVAWESYAGFPNDVFESIVVTGALSWSEIAQWYGKLFEKRYEISAEVAAAHRLELNRALTIDDSLRATYRWVAQDFRYVALALGDGGYQPRPPLEVLRTRFGDCKDKTTLFIGLARKMGVRAHPVLVRSSGSVDSLMPSLHHFDHMIAMVERDDHAEFLDLTTTLVPYGEIPPSLQGGVGMVLRGDTAEVIVLPAGDPATNRFEQEVVGTVGLDNRFVGSITVTASGTEQYGMREEFANWDAMEDQMRARLVQQYAQSTWESATVESSRVFEGRDLSAPVKVTVWFTVTNLLGHAGERYMMYVPLRNFGGPSLVTSLEASPNRRFPIDVAQVNGPSVHRTGIDIEFPEGWKVRLPRDVSAQGVFGYYQGQYRQHGRRLVAYREMGGRRGLEPPDSANALIEWMRRVSQDQTEYVLIDPSGVTLGSTPAGESGGQVADILLTSDDLGEGAMIASEGPTLDDEMFSIWSAKPVDGYTRDITASQMVFSFGSSQFAAMSVTAGAYRTHDEALKTQRFFDLVDLESLFNVMMGQQFGDQASIGAVRSMKLPSAGSAARGWNFEVLTPMVTLDMAFAVLTRGRVSATLLGVGPRGIRDDDFDRLLGIIDDRLRAKPEYLTDLALESDRAIATDDTEPTVAERAGGVPLDEILPTEQDFPESIIGSTAFQIVDGSPTFTRELEGRGFTFTIGGTQAVTVTLDVSLMPTAAQALKTVMIAERKDAEQLIADLMAEDPQTASMLISDSTSYEWVTPPRIGDRSIAGFMELRSALVVDVGWVTVSAGRLVTSVTVLAAPGALRMDDLFPIAEDIQRRMNRVAPDESGAAVTDDVMAAIRRVIALEEAVDSLIDEDAYDAVFAAIDRAKLSQAPVGFEPETWNGICWWGSLYGHAEKAMPACEATVLPDTTNLARRDSRALARALVGDTDGAIEDFRYVVENVAEGEFLTIRSGWLDKLLVGENPFTEDVLAELRSGKN